MIDTADVVFHRPSRETWVVAYVRGDRLCACGWPETLAALSDCVLVEKASEAERLDLLRRMADCGNDSRGRYARTALAAGESRPEHDPARAVQAWGETLTTPQDKARFLARYFRQFERSGHAVDGQPLHLFAADVLDALAAGEARPEPVAWRYPVYWHQPIAQHTKWHYIQHPDAIGFNAYEAGVRPEPLYAAPSQSAVEPTREMVRAAERELWLRGVRDVSDETVRAALVAAMGVKR